MDKSVDPGQLAIDLLSRSICSVQVAAVIVDRKGSIFAWGWNSCGSDGYGEHAECAAIRRANQRRLKHATIYVAARRRDRKWDKCVTAKPCLSCQYRLDRWGLSVVFRDGKGVWNG